MSRWFNNDNKFNYSVYEDKSLYGTQDFYVEKVHDNSKVFGQVRPGHKPETQPDLNIDYDKYKPNRLDTEIKQSLELKRDYNICQEYKEQLFEQKNVLVQSQFNKCYNDDEFNDNDVDNSQGFDNVLDDLDLDSNNNMVNNNFGYNNGQDQNNLLKQNFQKQNAMVEEMAPKPRVQSKLKPRPDDNKGDNMDKMISGFQNTKNNNRHYKTTQKTQNELGFDYKSQQNRHRGNNQTFGYNEADNSINNKTTNHGKRLQIVNKQENSSYNNKNLANYNVIKEHKAPKGRMSLGHRKVHRNRSISKQSQGYGVIEEVDEDEIENCQDNIVKHRKSVNKTQNHRNGNFRAHNQTSQYNNTSQKSQTEIGTYSSQNNRNRTIIRVSMNSTNKNSNVYMARFTVQELLDYAIDDHKTQIDGLIRNQNSVQGMFHIDRKEEIDTIWSYFEQDSSQGKEAYLVVGGTWGSESLLIVDMNQSDSSFSEVSALSKLCNY